jgi:hypothetical protein
LTFANGIKIAAAGSCASAEDIGDSWEARNKPLLIKDKERDVSGLVKER